MKNQALLKVCVNSELLLLCVYLKCTLLPMFSHSDDKEQDRRMIKENISIKIDFQKKSYKNNCSKFSKHSPIVVTHTRNKFKLFNYQCALIGKTIFYW